MSKTSSNTQQPIGMNLNDSINIYTNIPDQFAKYEGNQENSFDFFTSSGEFNLALFNKTFREEQLKRIAFYKKEEQKRINELNKNSRTAPKLHELNILEHMVNMKNTFFSIWSDLQTKPLNMSILTTGHRLFYIGLFFFIVFLIYLILNHIIIINKDKE
jgi:hypothetical protein